MSETGYRLSLHRNTVFVDLTMKRLAEGNCIRVGNVIGVIPN
jgi:hypothetical protein